MVVYALEGVEIDRCLACGGTWLDRGELERLAELAGGQSGEIARAVDAAGSGAKGRRRCPRCRRRLRGVALGGAPQGPTQSIEIDRCPRGHGLWFDRGEMEAVIAAYQGPREDAVARFFAGLYRQEIGSR
jgi:Zn-finger nucleic acid-binding protein